MTRYEYVVRAVGNVPQATERKLLRLLDKVVPGFKALAPLNYTGVLYVAESKKQCNVLKELYTRARHILPKSVDVEVKERVTTITVYCGDEP